MTQTIADRTDLPSDQRLALAVSGGMHDLAQPLSAIQIMLEMAMLNARATDPLKGTMEELLTQVERLTSYANYVSELARAHRPANDIGLFSLSDVAKLAVSDMQPVIIDSGASLSAEIQSSIFIYGSESRARRIVTNLLAGANEICPKGQNIEFKLFNSGGGLLISLATDTHEDLDEKPSAKRAFTLAEELVWSFAGRLRLSLHPLLIEVELPAQVVKS